ncbi:conserved hypothetical protein [Uncinocarpus reesii 1704]|uniref:Integral membrane protein n=1 Tax=Uncinocarpus reesii (strain UAMH 1704) TaxID=336963 RepID=C4JUW0_UNCRE|nr:uncharacterized protein UREG_04913 [Uncinocarpus reesii 1704]EEP80071.1 conserved hypothetical protein [Uncinocarpus reesii 1704]
MSVKFEKETVKTATKVGGELAQKVGAKLTGGKTQNGYLAGATMVRMLTMLGLAKAYIKQLQSNPLRTKMLTSGSLFGLQELLASWIAHDRSKHGHYFNSRIPKMAVYGAFISAPLGHFLIGILQRVFAGRTSLKAKILQILASNLINRFKLLIAILDAAQISPIQNVIYLASMAIIAGARTFHQVRATVKAGFFRVMKVSWVVSPLSLAFAQKFLPEQTWVPFFNIVGFIIGTYINAHTKKKRLEALRRKQYGSGKSTAGRSEDYPPRPNY